MVSPLRRLPLEKPQRRQRALPRHSVPRPGSACPHSGIAPGARRHRPSMAGRGILAAVPPAQRLRSASGKGAGRARSKAKAKARAEARPYISLRKTHTCRSTACRRRRWVRRCDVDCSTVIASKLGSHREMRTTSRSGWPMAAGPWSRTGARACRAWARHRTKGARALGYLGLFQVTRCKSETASSRCRRNG